MVLQPLQGLTPIPRATRRSAGQLCLLAGQYYVYVIRFVAFQPQNY